MSCLMVVSSVENVFLNSPLHRLSIVHGRMPWSEATLPMLLDDKLIDSYNLALQMPHTGKLSWEKTSANWWKIRFLRRKLSQIARCWYQKMPNVAYKTFTNSHKNSKFTKVFSLKSFPLNGMRLCIIPINAALLVVSCFWSWPKDQDLDHHTLILVQQSVVWTQDYPAKNIKTILTIL